MPRKKKTEAIPQTSNKEVLDLITSHVADNEHLRTLMQRTLYLKDFREFVKDAWVIIEPGTPYSHNWHIDFLSEELIALYIDELGKYYPNADIAKIKSTTKSRMSINIPTRAMKTLLLSVFFPCWIVLHIPTLKIATISYSDDLSRQINRQRREIINSQWYQNYFSDLVKIKDGMDRQDTFEFESLGMMYSTSVTGTFTGKGADLIILDDIQKPIDMYSDTERNKAILFLKETLPTRLNNRNTGKIINIQQRLHYQDVTGYLMDNLSNMYEFIKIPLIAEENEVWVGKVSGRRWKRKKNEVLWDERMNLEQAEMLRLELGSMAFEAQQQQNPTPEGGSLLQPIWFQYYDHTPRGLIQYIQGTHPEKFNDLQIVMSWDMNYKVAKDSDYAACVVGLYDNGTDETFIIDYVKERLNFNQLLLRMERLHTSWSDVGLPISVIVEEKANGQAVLEVMSQRIAGFIPYDPGNQDKVTRMKVVAPYVESKKVFLPDAQKTVWVSSMLTDLLKFPFIEHDDIPDAFSQLITRLYVGKKKKKVLHIF